MKQVRGVLLCGLLMAVCAVNVSADTAPPEQFEKGLLWRVSKDGELVGHVFGSFHSNDRRVIAVANLPKVSTLLSGAQNFAMETFPGTRYFNPHHGYQSILNDMMLDDGRLLVDLIGKDLYEKVNALLMKNGVPKDRITRLRPWAAMHSLGNIPSDGKSAAGLIQDQMLFEKAGEMTSNLYQLETLEELLAAHYDFPVDAQIGLLRDRVAFYERIKENRERMTTSYLDEDLGGMLKWNLSFISPSSIKLKYDEAYLKHVLHIRNVVMAHYMLAPLRRKQVFFAIGALHLHGQKGILGILRDAYGYQVEHVSLK